MMRSSAKMSVRDLRVEAGGRALLAEVSLRLEAGKVHGLIGRNGAGKSSLLKVLARQMRATSGAVEIDGEPVESMSPRAFARRVAFLPQEPPPAHGLTVRELAGFGRYAWTGAFRGLDAADHEAVRTALAHTGMTGFSGRLVSELSGGERQRAWLALLLAQEAGCALLDEPTSALDLGHQIDVMALLRRLTRERGLCTVVVLHDVNLAARFCDRIIALRDGRVSADDTPEALMTPPRLRAIYGVEMQVMAHPSLGVPVGLPA